MNNNLAKTDNSIKLNSLEYENLINQFFKERELSEKSKQSYKVNLNQFWKWLSEKDWFHLFINKQLNKNHLLAYKEFLKEGKLSARTINSYLVSLRQFFSFLVSYDLYPVNPLANIKSLKMENQKL